MFWDKGYFSSQNIENLLQKENVTLEEFLDDDDILEECKSQKKNLIQYLTRPDVIKRLIELIITEPPEDVSITQRFKHANMACEILTFGLPSLDEKLIEDEESLQTLYSYLEKEPPLNPLLSSFFSKTFSMLISKKPETDWFLYQKMCLQVLEFIKSRGNFLDLIFGHFATPVIMDLLHQIIREVQGELKKDLYEWLTEQNLVERLISMLGRSEDSEKHKNISEFICELIRYGRSMRQTDQLENDSFEQIFVSGNPLLLSIENHAAILQLVNIMIAPEAENTAIVAGVKIILTLADESIVDEPASDLALQLIMDKEKDNHDKIISFIVDVFEPKIFDFHNLLLKSPQKKYDICSDLPSPFGLTRLQICSLFTILIRIGDSRLIDAICKTDLFNTLLKLFKEYCWNNFLHSEVEKCLKCVFSNKLDSSKINNYDNIVNTMGNHLEVQKQEQLQTENNVNDNSNGDMIEDSQKNISALQKYAIVECRVISKLIDCWMYNKDMQSSENGRRLGYMGHLIKIFDTITTSISHCEQLGALIESNLSEDEIKSWRIITQNEDGELFKDLNTQKRMLADCNAYESVEFNSNLPKEFHIPSNFVRETSELCNDFCSNLPNLLDDVQIFGDISALGVLNEQFEDMNFENDYVNSFFNPLNMGTELSAALKKLSKVVTEIKTENPWGGDPFNCNSDNANEGDSNGWNKSNNEFFADFDSHFNDFDLGINNGASSNKIPNSNIESNSTKLNEFQGEDSQEQMVAENSDNNANFTNFEEFCNEKFSSFDDDEENFELNNTKKNAEKIIDSIVNDDNSDIISVEIDGIIGDESNAKMQTDEDDILVNKNIENNSFNPVQAETLDKTNNFSIKNSLFNGPLSDEFMSKNSSAIETTDKINSSNYCNDHNEININVKCSTVKDICSNSNENFNSDTKIESVEGGCDDTASVVVKSS